jgi:RNA polymerase sigma-70 factor (ECF subfamily)
MEAFEELVCRYDRQVLSIAMKFTRDIDQAKDVYQEVFLKVFKSLESFAFRSQFSTWLYRVATNVSLSHVSSEQRRREFSIDEDSKGQVSEKLVSKPDSDRKAFSREIGSRVQSALDSLSSQQRAVFVLRHYEGHRLREIASILKCAEGTVKKHLFTATVRMREQLRELHA